MTLHHADRSGSRLALAPGGVRRAVATVLLITVPAAGCYSTRPIQTAPEPGTKVLLDLNDRARVTLGERIGQSAERIEGNLQSMTDSSYVVRISGVRYIDGQFAQWSGELFTVPKEFVARARRQDFSRARTWGLVAGATAAIVFAVLKANLIGGGSGTQGGEPNPGGSGGT